MRTLILALIAVLVGQTPASACGPKTDCSIAGRTYRIDLPAEPTQATGALIYAHGYRGSARGAMRNKALRAFAHEMGLAFVAADAGTDDDWQIPNVPRNVTADGSREFDYFEALIGDLIGRHGLDGGQIIMTGFSAGGMMTWELACKRGHLFRAFIPISGTFWAPVPPGCATAPGDLVHIHGTSDKIVPLKGREIADTHQGDVFEAIAMAGRSGRFEQRGDFTLDGLDCRDQDNPDGRILVFCRHPGGHSMKTAFLKTAFEILRSRGRL